MATWTVTPCSPISIKSSWLSSFEDLTIQPPLLYSQVLIYISWHWRFVTALDYKNSRFIDIRHLYGNSSLPLQWFQLTFPELLQCFCARTCRLPLPQFWYRSKISLVVAIKTEVYFVQDEMFSFDLSAYFYVFLRETMFLSTLLLGSLCINGVKISYFNFKL